jgi:hypothetical protein
MSAAEAREALHEELVSSCSEVVGMIRKELDLAIADCRFGVTRGTALTRLGLSQLLQLKSLLFRIKPFQLKEQGVKDRSVSSKLLELRHHNSTIASVQTSHPTPSLIRSSTPSQSPNEFRPGTLVIARFPRDGYYYPGVIISVDEDEGTAYVAYASGEFEERVEFRRIVVRTPVVEGSSAIGCYIAGLEDCYPGTISLVHPSGAALIAFEDGEVQWFSPSDYYLPPYPTIVESDE